MPPDNLDSPDCVMPVTVRMYRRFSRIMLEDMLDPFRRLERECMPECGDADIGNRALNLPLAKDEKF